MPSSTVGFHHEAEAARSLDVGNAPAPEPDKVMRR